MRDLDETDREILRLLLQDARRPYSDIAARVDLSAPAVSDRIERLEELGVIRGFTLDLDRSRLTGGIPVLVELSLVPGAAERVHDDLSSLDAVENVFETADGDVVFQARVTDLDVVSLLEDVTDVTRVSDVSVRLLSASEWRPSVGDVSLALTCAECGNSVTTEGEAAVIGGSQYHFCCENCLAKFRDRFEELQQNA